MKKKNIRVAFPALPNSENPVEEEWIKGLRNEGIVFTKDTVLVGHSLGCVALMRLVESFDKNECAGKLIMVAGFGENLGISELENFFKTGFNWKKIKEKVRKIILVYSDNDPFISVEVSKRLIKKLNAEGILERGAGHINIGSGFMSYPRALRLVLDE